MKLKTGPTRRVHANNTRGAAFCGLGAFVGVGKTQRAHVYTAASLPVGPDDHKKIDPERRARELEVDQCAVNSGRFWMMDEVDYAGGGTVDFHGVKMNWAGDMTGAEMIAQFQSAYVPSLIQKALPQIAAAFEKSRSEQLLLMLVELKYEGAFGLLLLLLESPRLAERLTAIRELGKLGNQEVIPYLLEQLEQDDPMLQSEAVLALAKLSALEAIPSILDLLTDDELYGPRSAVYHAVTVAFQNLGGISEQIRDAFPESYPAMFNMGGAPLSLPEAMGLLDKDQSPLMIEALTKFQHGSQDPASPADPLGGMMRKALDDMAWKVGVMFADARDARQDRVKRLLDLLGSGVPLTRAAAALTLPWYGEGRALEPLQGLAHDPDDTVRNAATWAGSALRKAISYRNHFGK